MKDLSVRCDYLCIYHEELELVMIYKGHHPVGRIQYVFCVENILNYLDILATPVCPATQIYKDISAYLLSSIQMYLRDVLPEDGSMPLEGIDLVGNKAQEWVRNISKEELLIILA